MENPIGLYWFLFFDLDINPQMAVGLSMAPFL